MKTSVVLVATLRTSDTIEVGPVDAVSLSRGAQSESADLLFRNNLQYLAPGQASVVAWLLLASIKQSSALSR